MKLKNHPIYNDLPTEVAPGVFLMSVEHHVEIPVLTQIWWGIVDSFFIVMIVAPIIIPFHIISSKLS